MMAMNLLLETDRFRFIDWGRRSYKSSVAEMKLLLEERLAGEGKDTVFLVEHDPVITMGRRARRQDIIGPFNLEKSEVSGIPVVPTDRGGGITLHSPGQLVIYPVVALELKEQNLHDLLSAYEELVIRTSRDFGIDAFRVKGKTGAWTEHGKLASIGIHLKRWITYHGIALNASNDLGIFDHIVPCGLQGIKMTSLEREAGQMIDLTDVKAKVLRHFLPVWEAFHNRRI